MPPSSPRPHRVATDASAWQAGAEEDRPLAQFARLVPLAAALAGTFVYHRYSLLTGLDRVQADTADSRFVAFILEHWNNALHGRAEWRSPPIFWPVPDVLAYSDMLFGMGALHAALRSGLGVFEAINAQLVLLTLLTFATGYALFRRGFALSVGGATVGAAFFAFSWPRFAQLVHLQLQFTPLLPLLALWSLECLRDGMQLSRPGFAARAAGLGAAAALLLATTPYYAIFFALALCLALLLCLSVRTGRMHLAAVLRRHVAGVAAATSLLALLVVPVVSLYAPVVRESGGRSWAEVLPFLPRPGQFVWIGTENWAWGWVFSRWPVAVVDGRWAELRIGVGVVASVAWAAAGLWAAWSLLARRRTLEAGRVALCLTLVVGLLLQLLMTRLPHDFSAWWLVWTAFPGANGLRAVARLEIVVTLAMGLAFGAAFDAGWRRGGVAAVLAVVLVGACAVEQFGRVHGFSGSRAEALSRDVGARLAAGLTGACRAAYVIGTPGMMSVAAPVDASQFDAAAYLAANPDVAANWGESAWSHYEKFGRAEHRSLDADAGRTRRLVVALAYTSTIPLAASLSGVPVVNGLSGWQPPGWALDDVLDPDARVRLAPWLARHGELPDRVCVVPTRLTLEMVPFLPEGWWPR